MNCSLKRLNSNEKDVYKRQKDTIKEMGSLLNNLTLFISAIAAISLVIAGVGVMNMMYISVSERIKEIGIRRALGGTASDITVSYTHLDVYKRQENVYARHRKNDRILVESLQKMGLEIFGKLDTKTPTVIPVVIPEGIDGEKVRSLLLDHFKVEIASSFGDLKGKIWRVGNMGYSSREDNVLHFLSAFETVLKHQGYQFEGGSGSTHALAEYLN